MPAIVNKLNVHIRWMIKRDLDSVLKIEASNSQLASPVGRWTEEDFLAILGKANNIGMVAEHCEQVLGFTVYSLHPEKLHIFNIAVDKSYENMGVGTQIIKKLKSKLMPHRRKILEIDVRESNLHAQLFLKRCGFLAVEVVRNWYEQPCQEDAYRFRYNMEQ